MSDAVGSISHILKTAFKDVYADEDRRKEENVEASASPAKEAVEAKEDEGEDEKAKRRARENGAAALASSGGGRATAHARASVQEERLTAMESQIRENAAKLDAVLKLLQGGAARR